MIMRLADMNDLPRLKAVYGSIIDRMNRDNLRIWDEIYPCEFFGEDIKRRRLYVLVEDTELVSAFALCESHPGADNVTWEDGQSKALYLDRLGVNVDYGRKGIGSMALERAAALAGEQGARYLRLFVVEDNEPAIRLYLKNGFQKANGWYDEVIDKDLTLREFGFETRALT